MAPPRIAVVGHVEWVTFAEGRVPGVGEIAQLDGAVDEPGGGGAVAAVAAASLGTRCTFLTAVGDDAAGDAIGERLAAAGVDVVAAARPVPHPRALTVLDPTGERTILVTGGRLSPTIDDPLPWSDLARFDAVYFIGDDPRTVMAARSARHLVVSARRMDAYRQSGVRADVIVGSATDPFEQFDLASLEVAPRVRVVTEGAAGGYVVAGDATRRYAPVAPAGPHVDAYGAGDSFAGALTVGLGTGLPLEDALELAAAAGARATTARGGIEPHLG